MLGLCDISYHLQHERACKPRGGALTFGAKAQLHEKLKRVRATPEPGRGVEGASEPKSPGYLRVTVGRKPAITRRRLVLIDNTLTSGVRVDAVRPPLPHA